MFFCEKGWCVFKHVYWLCRKFWGKPQRKTHGLALSPLNVLFKLDVSASLLDQRKLLLYCIDLVPHTVFPPTLHAQISHSAFSVRALIRVSWSRWTGIALVSRAICYLTGAQTLKGRADLGPVNVRRSADAACGGFELLTEARPFVCPPAQMKRNQRWCSL